MQLRNEYVVSADTHAKDNTPRLILMCDSCSGCSSCATMQCQCDCAFENFDCCKGQFCSGHRSCYACCAGIGSCLWSRISCMPCVENDQVFDLCRCGEDVCWLSWLCDCTNPSLQLAPNGAWGQQFGNDAFFDVALCSCCQVSRQWNAFRYHPNECDCGKTMAACIFLPFLSASLRHRTFDRYGIPERGCVTLFTGAFCPLCSLCATHHALTISGVPPGGTCCGVIDDQVTPMQGASTLPPMPGAPGLSPGQPSATSHFPASSGPMV